MKSGLFRTSACAFALILLSSCGKSEESGAAAATGAAFASAADALSAKLKSGVPAANDPAVAAFDSEAGKALKTLGTPALPVRGFNSYDALCGKTATIVGAYAAAGTEGLPEAEKPARMERNVTQYIDQIFTPLLFSAHCSAAHMPFIQETVGSNTDEKAAALQQVRGGLWGQATGLLQMAAAPDLDEPRRGRVLEQLGADASNFAIVFSAAQRRELASAADAVRAKVPEAARGQLDQLKSSLAAAPCGPLCKM